MLNAQRRSMERDEIIEIGIDKEDRLYLNPKLKKFPYIYREAAEVHWDSEHNYLYSPKPREWSYLDWYKHIVDVAASQACKLFITDNTQWINIPDDLKTKIIQLKAIEGT